MLAQQRIGIALAAALVFLYALWFTHSGILNEGNPTPINPERPGSIIDQHTSPNHTLEEWGNDGFDGLTDLCQQAQWTDGLWLHCHSYCGPKKTSICGGLNNARNRIQTCLRLAIDTGAGLILPSTTERDEKNLVLTDDRVVCPEVFWNIDHLQMSLREQCPQLKLRLCDDRKGIKNVVETEKREYLSAAHTPGTFQKFVNSAFASSPFNLSDVSAKNPAVVNYGDSYIGWNYREAGELTTIRKALFKVLKFNQKLLDLSSQIYKHPKLHDGAYIGVHLRGEDDWPVEFGSVDDQMRLYTEEIQRIQPTVSYEIKTVYVSVSISIQPPGTRVDISNSVAMRLLFNVSVICYILSATK